LEQAQAETPAAARPGADAASLLSIRGLVKDFGGTRAVDHVDMDVEGGEIHALLGENGAGKSTVIKVLAGLYAPDAGEVLFGGEPVHPTVQRLPIGFIHQDLALMETMTVAENIGLVAGYPQRASLISWRQLRSFGVEALARAGAEIEPDALVSRLSFSEKSIVAIARALALDVAVLVLDEPTAALPEEDTERLFEILRTLRERGVGIIYVTHRIDEVFRIADRITVLRDGRRVATSGAPQVTQPELVKQIVGRPPAEVFPRVAKPSPEPALQLTDVSTAEAGPASLTADAGAIVALVGLRGAGQESIGRALFGDQPMTAGRVLLNGSRLEPAHPWEAIEAGVGFISSKRAEESMAPGLSVCENLFLNPAIQLRDSRGRTGDRAERERAAQVARDFDIRPPRPEVPIATLSGGNQQKVVLARWLIGNSTLLILEEPTAGIDIGAKAEIYGSLAPLLDRGGVALLVSSDFEEVARIATRAFVFHRGRIAAEIEQSDLTRELLTHVACGGALHNGEVDG
jgi:ribose transport system ATP-binding protein